MDNACVASWPMIPILLPISLPISDLSNPILFNQSIHMRGTYRGSGSIGYPGLGKVSEYFGHRKPFQLITKSLKLLPCTCFNPSDKWNLAIYALWNKTQVW